MTKLSQEKSCESFKAGDLGITLTNRTISNKYEGTFQNSKT